MQRNQETEQHNRELEMKLKAQELRMKLFAICLVWWNVVHLQIDSGSAGCDAGGAGGVLAAQRAWVATPSQQFY